jgi:hypothetical protein
MDNKLIEFFKNEGRINRSYDDKYIISKLKNYL